MRKQAGFTLIELLVTLSVVAILVTLAVPNMKLTFQNNRLVTQANDLLGSLIYARSEATEVGSNVTICASSDGATCSGSNWATGWIISYVNGGTTTLLRSHAAISGGNTLASGTNLGASIAFTNTGTLATGLGGNFSLCDTRGSAAGRSLTLMASGQARLSITPGKQIDGVTAVNCSSP